MKPEVILDYDCHAGEGPIWHPSHKRLYWTDITRLTPQQINTLIGMLRAGRISWEGLPKGRMFWYDPATGQHKQFYEGRIVSGFTVQADGSLLLFMRPCAVAKWINVKLEYVLESVPEAGETGFNDVLADPAGRVFCGSFETSTTKGKLFRLDLDGSIKVVLDDVGVSNGLGFSPDHKHLYYTDSNARKIYNFDYNEATGEITNRRVFVDVSGEEGVPDGLTVDAEGYIWSARWDGRALHRYAPDGTEERQIRFPTKKIASLIFGGEGYTDIYVTTGGGYNKEENGQEAGALFRVSLGIKGRPEFLSRIRL
jgi:D-xylonolactonase